MCSIIVLVKQKKPIISNGVGAPTQIDFFNTYIQIHCHEKARIWNIADMPCKVIITYLFELSQAISSISAKVSNYITEY